MKDAVENVPVVILCGGKGTRLREETELKPKPLVEIGGRPILWHIMKHYGHYGFTEFILALGYRGDLIKRYFLDYFSLSQDFAISLHDGRVERLGRNGAEPWHVRMVDTGADTLTGGRLKILEPHIAGRTFMLTYGDGVSDVDLGGLLGAHRSHGKAVTLTAVRPPARFGALDLGDGHAVRGFKEKPHMDEGWINGGFFVVEPTALTHIQQDVMWEHGPMEQLTASGQVQAYPHEGFWQCVDTLRDLRLLESLWDSGTPPWKTW